ncbi:peptidase S1 [Rubellimicrobium roseum]|uniref:Peptidase S1 n=1 Tax=Rubellimicrobium roseum TaxID=687525 RepID=A0A5C4NI48_9RHOB|nr:peptidase S1 [Rubellimicrobium roseum]TNC73782.1 peptidase S1 [Rubellimicrobium roseum]
MKVLFAAAALSVLAAAPALACPNWEASPSFGQIDLSAGFMPDPYVRNITAGGRYDLAGCFGSNGWGGSVASKPDFDLYWSGNSSALTISVNSGSDTVLLINAPDGEWYYSDDPAAITFRSPQQGLYDIWIGSYGGHSGIPGQLVITER